MIGLFMPDGAYMYQRTGSPLLQLLAHLLLGKTASIFADDILKCISLIDRIPIEISLKFVPTSPIDNKPALDQVMAWRRTGDKPLPESTMVRFSDIYVGGWVGMN